ncbi:MAG: formylglycine-generating enzyme family protein [Alcanivorax sp.]|uniref:formylglycine-generating enzyme family protein n=1 Tax=Alloalcanivorax xenomutans TaxID=1094342 RepID=UPI0006D77B79|nr:formylglycine-generating enzyme family protein [Alloalcanivorax xenomutans]MBA4721560.1 formylglycine-generating enzyme family protein [Alcanivorax sp.]
MNGKGSWIPLLCLLTTAALANEYVPLSGGPFHSSLRFGDNGGEVVVEGYQLMSRPVREAEFLAFVQAHPQWRRDRNPGLFADAGYLSHWDRPLAPRPGTLNFPVTRVSWFAADAYCRARGARLPTWLEWEFAAAADAHQTDARDDADRRRRILTLGTPGAYRAAGESVPNVYGVHDLHGLVWEWPWDHASMMAAADSRNVDTENPLRYCGGSALAFSDRRDYAVIKRVALLSALSARTTLSNLGFRCAKELP